MKPIILLAFITGSGLAAKAQQAGIQGTVTDGSAKIVESASITLHRAQDSSAVKFSVASKDGHYGFDGIAAGNYLISVTAVGHEKVWSAPISFTGAPLSVANLQLVPVSRTMATVTVAGKRPLIEQKIDRTVINVDASPTNVGATALEVLEKSPGVTVDKDGTISLKGKQGVQVMIDGRPAYLSGNELAAYLRSLPAGAIDQIELMTQPSAKYDASGNAGIINLRMKKNRMKGFNGSLSLAATQGKRTRFNNSLNLNYRTGKWNLFTNLNHSHFERYQNLDIQRSFRQNGNLTAVFEQQTRQRDMNEYMGGKIGADYFLSRRTTIGVVVSGGTNPETGISSSTSLLKDGQNNLDSIVSADSRSKNTWHNAAVNVNFRHQFDSTGRELTADIDVIGYNTGAAQRFYNTAYNPFWIKQSGDQLRGNIPVEIRIYSGKADYQQPLKGGAKLEAGVKGSYVRTHNSAGYFNVTGAGEKADSSKTNKFNYEETIGAAYLNLNKQFGKWGLQGGLRYEHTSYSGFQFGSPDHAKHPDSSFSRSYGSLFPTAFVSFEANKKNTFTFSYGRRIDRPSYQNLNPFLFFIDKYTYEQGNPFIRPQFTDNIEIGHSFKGFLNTSVNYSLTKDLMNDTFQQDTSAQGGSGYATVVKNGNIGRRESAGFTMNAQVPVTKWWSTMLYGNYNWARFTGRLNGTGEYIHVSAGTLTFNANNQFSFGKGWTAELGGWYRTGGLEGQIYIYPLAQISGGAGKTILKGKGSVKFNVRDIFFTNRVKGDINFQGTEAHFQQIRDSRNVTLSFTWRFGKPINDAPKRHASGAEQEQSRVKGAQ